MAVRSPRTVGPRLNAPTEACRFPMPELLPLLARQPIFNRKMQVVAYELLYRSSDMNKATFNDGDRASSQVILNTYGNLSMRSEEHTSELQSRGHLVCRLLLEKNK